MENTLAATLALLATRLSDASRAAFVEVLPEALAASAGESIRRAQGPDGEVLSPWQSGLLAVFAAPGDAEQGAGAPFPTEGAATLFALLCAAASPRPAAAFLTSLPLSLQGAVLLKIVKGTRLSLVRGLPPEERILVEALEAQVGATPIWGVEATCRILRQVEGAAPLRRVLDAAAQSDPEAVVVLQNHLFDLGDLLRLSDRDLQTLLLQIDDATLGLALQGLREPSRRRLLANVSTRRRRRVAEEVERWSTATTGEVERARVQILATARLLYERGRISTYFGSLAAQAEEGEGVWEEDGQEEEQGEEEQAEEGEEGEGEASGNGEEKRFPFKALLGGLAVLAGAGLAAWLAPGSPGGAEKEGAGKARQERQAVVASSGTSEGASLPAGEPSKGADGEGGAPLLAGERLSTAEGEEALLSEPGIALLQVGEASQIERPVQGGSPYLRAGQVRAAVQENPFSLETPLYRVEGRAGSLFEVRVVLDASTFVEVEKGMVEVFALGGGHEPWRLKAGSRGRFGSDGRVSLSAD